MNKKNHQLDIFLTFEVDHFPKLTDFTGMVKKGFN